MMLGSARIGVDLGLPDSTATFRWTGRLLASKGACGRA